MYGTSKRGRMVSLLNNATHMRPVQCCNLSGGVALIVWFATNGGRSNSLLGTGWVLVPVGGCDQTQACTWGLSCH